MRLKRVTVKWFRSIVDQAVDLDHLTAFVGANGAGKSSFLRALEVFYDPDAEVTIDDFYDRDTSGEISIAATFIDLPPAAQQRFAAYADGGELTVERVVRWEDDGPKTFYYGSSLQHKPFSRCRMAGSASDQKRLYATLRRNPKYADLPAWRNQATAMQNLSTWETAHPDECERMRDQGEFFGFKQADQGYLGGMSRFLLVPAVRDAVEETQEGRGSVLTELLDLVVRGALSGNKAVEKLERETIQKYRRVLGPTTGRELRGLANELTNTLRTFVPSASVTLKWRDLEGFELPTPTADVHLVEDGFDSTVERTGHGLQRAFVLTLLQQLGRVRAETSEPEDSDEGESSSGRALPSLVLAIEEPELYQHPTRQRHLAQVLFGIAGRELSGVASFAQVIYATHSPHFVGLDRFNQVRLCRKVVVADDHPRATGVVAAVMQRVATALWRACGEVGPEYTPATLLPRLKGLMTTSLAEGFFAEVVVLVEGEGDRAAIMTTAKGMNVDLDSLGISVIPCVGKSNIDRPALIFRELGIPTYLVWDGDRGRPDAHPEANERLLRVVGEAPQEWPSAQAANYTVFGTTLDDVIKTGLGPEHYDSWLHSLRTEFNLQGANAKKNPMVLEGLLTRASESGQRIPLLEGIVEKVVALCPAER